MLLLKWSFNKRKDHISLHLVFSPSLTALPQWKQKNKEWRVVVFFHNTFDQWRFIKMLLTGSKSEIFDRVGHTICICDFCYTHHNVLHFNQNVFMASRLRCTAISFSMVSDIKYRTRSAHSILMTTDKLCQTNLHKHSFKIPKRICPQCIGHDIIWMMTDTNKIQIKKPNCSTNRSIERKF